MTANVWVQDNPGTTQNLVYSPRSGTRNLRDDARGPRHDGFRRAPQETNEAA